MLCVCAWRQYEILDTGLGDLGSLPSSANDLLQGKLLLLPFPHFLVLCTETASASRQGLSLRVCTVTAQWPQGH